MRQTLDVDCNVTVQVRDAVTGELLHQQEHHNLVVDAGLNLLRDFLDGDAVTGITHFGYGTGTTAPTAAETALVAQTARDVLTGKVGTVSKTWTATYYMSSSTGNGSTYGEAGLFTAASGGTMFARVKLNPAIAKTASIAVTFSWSINLGAS